LSAGSLRHEPRLVFLKRAILGNENLNSNKIGWKIQEMNVYLPYKISELKTIVVEFRFAHFLNKSMSKLFYGIVCLLSLSSCVGQYAINGVSTIPSLDGQKIFLKVVNGNDFVSIDSCEINQGKFRFNGRLDSIMMGALYSDDGNLMPIVVEEGDLKVSIADTAQNVSGGSLNETLYEFISKKARLDNQMAALSHKESQMIMDGDDPDAIQIKLSDEARRIAKQSDFLITNFITDNSDNVLGPGMFMIMTSSYRYPIMTPQIEDIMSKVSPYFTNNAYVKDYMRIAQENMKRMQNAPDLEEMPQ
jgi:hypothetical protein